MNTMRPKWIGIGLLLLALLPGDLALAKLAFGRDVLGVASRTGAAAAQRVVREGSRLAVTVLGHGVARAGDVAEGAARWLAGAGCSRATELAMDFDPESATPARVAAGATTRVPIRVIEREARCIAARERALATAREALRSQGLLHDDAMASARESLRARAIAHAIEKRELRVIAILGVRPSVAMPAPVAPIAPATPVTPAGS